MATWTDITAAQTAVDAALTSELATAWTENLKSALEGASGAPRMATKNQFGNGQTGNTDFTVTNMSGARFFIGVRNNGAAFRTMTINASDGSFGTAQTLLTISANEDYSAHGYVDFATGDFSVAQGDGLVTSGTLTVTGDLTTLRFTGSLDLFYSVHNMPDGGETTV